MTQFILHSLAAALITGKAGSAIAMGNEAYNAAFNNRNKLLLLLSPLQKEGTNLYLTGKLVNPADWQVRINRYKTTNRSFVLLHQQGNHTAYQVPSALSLFNRQGKMAKSNSPQIPSASSLFSIIKNGNFSVGVIDLKNYANPAMIHPEEISRLASNLKEHHNCKIVVCISQLGFKTNENLDDYRLASNINGLDLIVGFKNQSLLPAGPMVVLNQQKQEVIIHYQANHKLDLSAIEWTFNQKGEKSNIAFMA